MCNLLDGKVVLTTNPSQVSVFCAFNYCSDGGSGKLSHLLSICIFIQRLSQKLYLCFIEPTSSPCMYTSVTLLHKQQATQHHASHLQNYVLCQIQSLPVSLRCIASANISSSSCYALLELTKFSNDGRRSLQPTSLVPLCKLLW